MKEFSKIGEYVVKDAQARESIEELGKRLDEGVNGGLPSVSVEDNGKVLKVVGGEWKASPQSDKPLTDEQKNEIFAYVKSKLQTKAFVFTLDDDSTVTVNVVVKE